MAQDPRLVEMVARAICKADGGKCDHVENSTAMWQYYVKYAEAAIAVINRSMNPAG